MKIRYLLLLFATSTLSSAQENVLTLDAAIQRALVRNEQSLAADQTYKAAESRVTRARAFFLPLVTATGVYTRRPFQVVRDFQGTQIAIQRYNALSGVIGLNLTLFDALSIPGYRSARSEEAAQMYASAEEKRQLAFEVGNAYLATLGVDQVLVASEHRYEYAKQALDAARARYKGGLVGVNDVTRAELEFATAEMGVTQVKGQVQTAYLQLGYLLDDPDTPRKKLEVPDFLLKAAEEVALPADPMIAEAQNRRLDLNSLRWRAKSQHALVLSPTLKWFPVLALTGQYRYTNEAGFTGQNTNWNVGATLSWSLFDGFARNGEYGERKALAEVSDLNVQATMRLVELQVREAQVLLENQRAALRQAVVAHDAAVRNATEIAELYRQGLASALEVADANVRMFEAEVTLVRERYGLAIAHLNLEAALGLDPFGKEP
ncbi:MAG: TolC family protein, partial [Acidobacteriota bacterium]